MTQYGRPNQDITATGWTASSGSTLYGCVDETPYSDTDYIRGTGAVTVELKLSGVTDPVSSGSHVVNWRAKSNGTSAGEKWTCTLYQGTTLRATMTSATTVSRSATDYTYTLSGAEADAITSYTDLRIRIALTTIGAAETVDVYFMEMSFPDVAASVLTIQDSENAETVENAVITAHAPTFSLTIQDIGQTGTVENCLITYHAPTYNLTFQDSEDTQTVENAVITAHVPTFSLTIADGGQTETVENCVITANYTLTFQDAENAQSAENATITNHDPPLPTRTDGSRHFTSATNRMYWDSIHDVTGHDITLSIWLNYDYFDAEFTVFAIGGNGNTTPGILLNVGYGWGAMQFIRPATINARIESDIAISAGEWFNIIITSPGSLTGAKAYLNGTEVTYDLNNNGSGTEVTNNGRWAVGGAYNAGDTYDAHIGEVAVWSRILDSTEIDGLTDWGNPQSGMNYDTDLLFCVHPDEPEDLVTSSSPTLLTGTHADNGPDLDYPAVAAELTIQDSGQTDTVENAVITYYPPSYSVTIADATQTETVEKGTITYYPHYDMTFADASQSQTSEKATITYYPHYNLIFADAGQTQSAEKPTLTATIPTFSLTAQDTYELQIVDNVIIIIPTTSWVLEMQDTEHLQYADNLYIGEPVTTPSVFVGTITRATVTITKPTVQCEKPVIVVKRSY